MRHVDLEQVEPGRVRPPRGGHELRAAPRPCPRGSSRAAPVDAVRRTAAATARSAASCRRRSGSSSPSHISLRRALAPGVPELRADRRARVLVHEVDDPLPGRHVLVAVQPAAAGRDPARRRWCRSSRSSPARRRRSPARPRCTRWKSPGVPSTEEYMSIGETTTRLASSSPRSRKGSNIGGTPSLSAATKSGSRIRSSPWVIRRERVSRLKANDARVLLDVAADPLEPLERALRRALRALDDRPRARPRRRRCRPPAPPRPARSRPPSPAWCPTRSRSARCARRRRAGRRSRRASARCAR